MPHSIAMLNPRNTSPPRNSSDRTASATVLTVSIVRDKVSFSARLIRSPSGMRGGFFASTFAHPVVDDDGVVDLNTRRR